MMVTEIVLAIDPALRKVEEILLWKNKFKTAGVFTFCHVLFWLFQSFNIRTYCTIACACLILHLLDAYRTKKRREILRLQQQAANNQKDPICSLGHHIIKVYTSSILVWTELRKLKSKNRLHYFVVLFIFWSMSAVIGYKIKGFYLSYFLFWIIFFVPAIIHYDIFRKMLSKALPLLQQLDQSMKYERRSILDKSELLVDVKLPSTDDYDDQQEDEYLKSFKLDDFDKMKEKQRRVFENLEDDEDDEMSVEKSTNGYDLNLDDDFGDEDDSSLRDEEVIVEEIVYYKDNTVVKTQKKEEKPLAADQSYEINQRLNRKMRNYKLSNHEDDEDELNSFLPNESFPSLDDDTLDNTGMEAASESFFNDLTQNMAANLMPASGDKIIKPKRTKNRPSLLDYYANIPTSTQQSSNQQQQHGYNTRQKSNQNLDQPDLDETFEFLDNE